MEIVQNPSKLPKTVDIVLANGIKDQVFIQPNSRVKLPPGASVASSFIERDKSLVIKKS